MGASFTFASFFCYNSSIMRPSVMAPDPAKKARAKKHAVEYGAGAYCDPIKHPIATKSNEILPTCFNAYLLK